jgi:rod shape-determining protein MreC
VLASSKRAPRTVRPFLFLFGMSVMLLLARDSDPVRAAQSAAAQVLVPLQQFTAGTGASISAFFATIEEIDRLRADNASLRGSVESLTLENVQLRERALAAEQAAKLQQVAAGLPYETVPAQVIARDPSGVVRAITLDVGSDRGVAVGHIVLATQGLVGRITQVGPNYSKVVPITDSSSAISGMVQRSRATGIVRGLFGDTLVLEWILQSEEMAPGDAVVTAGIALSNELRSLYPKGFLIGTVADVQKADVLAYQKAVVRPAVDFRRLERVLVVKAE